MEVNGGQPHKDGGGQIALRERVEEIHVADNLGLNTDVFPRNFSRVVLNLQPHSEQVVHKLGATVVVDNNTWRGGFDRRERGNALDLHNCGVSRAFCM